jgi:ATPase subunit of ABC transporter with duplicated ATPase domains
MLTVHNLTKSYSIQPILNDISFNISDGERIGLIGPNGCGKSTLMRILAGLEAPDSGTISRTRSNLRVGYLAQGFEPAPGATIQSTLNLGCVSEVDLEAEITSLAMQLVAEPANLQLQDKYDKTLQKLSNPFSANSVLIPLGLSELDGEMPVFISFWRAKDQANVSHTLAQRTSPVATRRTHQPPRYSNARMARRLAE